MSLTKQSINYLRHTWDWNDTTLSLIQKAVSDPKFLEAQELQVIPDESPSDTSPEVERLVEVCKEYTRPGCFLDNGEYENWYKRLKSALKPYQK
jgi:hypothetical protein